MVGKTQDYDLPNTKFRSFTPEGTAPSSQGWPVLIYFHGGENSSLLDTTIVSKSGLWADLGALGGWTLGNIASESAFATNMCVRTSVT